MTTTLLLPAITDIFKLRIIRNNMNMARSKLHFKIT